MGSPRSFYAKSTAFEIGDTLDCSDIGLVSTSSFGDGVVTTTYEVLIDSTSDKYLDECGIKYSLCV